MQTIPERSAEPLVELTHVISMFGNSQNNQLQAFKPASRQCSVASEMLVTAALRLQWPADRRKVTNVDAAHVCRDAAALLQEAAQQLLGVSSEFENGGSSASSKAHEFKPLIGSGACGGSDAVSESKGLRKDPRWPAQISFQSVEAAPNLWWIFAGASAVAEWCHRRGPFGHVSG